MSDDELIAELARLKAEGERIQRDHEAECQRIAAESEARCSRMAADCEAMERKLAAEVQRQQREERRRLQAAFHLAVAGLRASPALMSRLVDGSPVRVGRRAVFPDRIQDGVNGLAEFVRGLEVAEPELAAECWVTRYGPIEQALERQQMREAQRRFLGETTHDE